MADIVPKAKRKGDFGKGFPKSESSGDFTTGFPKGTTPGSPVTTPINVKEMEQPSQGRLPVGGGPSAKEFAAAQASFEYTKRTGKKFIDL